MQHGPFEEPLRLAGGTCLEPFQRTGFEAVRGGERRPFCQTGSNALIYRHPYPRHPHAHAPIIARLIDALSVFITIPPVLAVAQPGPTPSMHAKFYLHPKPMHSSHR